MQIDPGPSGRPVQREAKEQEALFRWRALVVVSGRYPGIEWMFAIPNGAHLQGDAKRRAMQWARLKAQGARAGVSDIFLPVRDHLHQVSGLWIELKAPKPHAATVSQEQQDWIAAMRREGHAAHVAYGWVQAVEFINQHYGITK